MKINKIFYKLLKRILSPIGYAKRVGVKIGNDCIISTCNWGSEPYLITIGNRVRITGKVSFINHDGGVWVFRDEIKDFDVFGKIYIGDNTFIGNNSTILPGVSVGRNCVIGANSVVSKSIPDNSVVAGVPAQFICSIEDYKQKLLPYNAKTKLLKQNDRRSIITSLPDEVLIRKKSLTSKVFNKK